MTSMHALTTEIEHKYLLSGVPPRIEGAPSKTLRQGYLPGEVLVERVRHISTAEGDTYVRTVKAGTGVERIELEEECDAALFEALWALTGDCQIAKVRYLVPDGELTWEVDVFTDRELVLAEIEVPTVDTVVVFPDWLAPFVVREVTSELAYTNWQLSKQP